MLKTVFKILFSLPLLMIPLTLFILWGSGMTYLLGWHS